jgi:hypothetical protein
MVFPEVTVLFADIVDFTRMSASLTPEGTVAWLNELFSSFDALSERFGLPVPRPDHADVAAEMALEIQRELASGGIRTEVTRQCEACGSIPSAEKLRHSIA